MTQLPPETEDQFIEELSKSKSKQSAFNSKKKTTEISGKGFDKSKVFLLPQTIMKKRFHEHIELIKKGIGGVEDNCQKFGGIEFIRQQLDKNQITREDYMDYCISRIGKNFELPKLKIRSESLPNFKPTNKLGTEKKVKFPYNKWFINPEERFSKSKEITKYEWNKDSFMLNIIKKRNNSLNHRCLPEFINHSQEKLQRKPLLCKYTLINPEN